MEEAIKCKIDSQLRLFLKAINQGTYKQTKQIRVVGYKTLHDLLT